MDEGQENSIARIATMLLSATAQTFRIDPFLAILSGKKVFKKPNLSQVLSIEETITVVRPISAQIGLEDGGDFSVQCFWYRICVALVLHPYFAEVTLWSPILYHKI